MKIKATARQALEQFIKDGTRFNALITDPPYDTGQLGAGKIVRQFQVMPTRECVATIMQYKQVLLPGADVYVFGNWRSAVEAVPLFESDGWPVLSFIPWLKNELGVGHYWRNCCEYILHLTNGKKERGPQADRTLYYPPAFIKLQGDQRRRMGGFKKPWEVYLQLLRPTIGKGDLVVDPFAGSCPLEQAAAMLGAKAYCVDVDFDWPTKETEE